MPPACGGMEYIERVNELLQCVLGERVRQLTLRRAKVSGGLQARSVELLTACYLDVLGRRREFTCVVKRVEQITSREAEIYRLLQSAFHAPAPKLLGALPLADGTAELWLQHIAAPAEWPWRDVTAAAEVMRCIAEVHVHGRRLECPPWDYEHELIHSAAGTVDAMLRARAGGDLPGAARGMLPALKRFVAKLPATRSALLADTNFRCGLIHGDVHTGNVLITHREVGRVIWMIDWERARAGSALEDVSSWLRSLGVWEPEACRRHDTLLQRYLVDRGCSAFLSSDLRAAHWAAGACNALSGALAYHLWQMSAALDSTERRLAARCVLAYLRVIRRADALVH